jgi:hypothetical protein
MIVFELLCVCGFQFEGWFKDSDEYQQQQKEGLLACPACGGGQVHKILSPVGLQIGFAAEDVTGQEAGWTIDGEKKEHLQLLQALQKYVLDNFENVGPRLAEEALKMQYGVAEQRSVRGVATLDEEKMLEKEGIELLKIPFLTDDEEAN